jgi:murein DD-endopeptidase MepM/ murein hydrolase activator NlpD
LQHITVEPGQQVTRGRQVGGMGDTGHSTGYHLHYEVLMENGPIDPAPYLTAKFF